MKISSILSGIAIFAILFYLLTRKTKYMISDYIKVVFGNETLAGDEAKITSDTGGLTKYGISDLADKIKDGKYFGIDIALMSKEQAIQIYQNEYFNPLAAQFLDYPSIALEVFDISVNRGVKTAMNTLFNAFNVRSIQEVKNYISKFGETNSIARLKEQRINDYKNLANNPIYTKYLNGWLNRVKKTHF